MKTLLLTAALFIGGSGLVLAAEAPATSPTATDIQARMQQNYARMQALMQQIHAAHGAQRHDMMQQHWQLMHSQMGLMQQMMGTAGSRGGMGGTGMMQGGGMHGSGVTGTGTAAADCSQYRQRMQSMQQLMKQMLEQEKALLQSQKP